MPTTDPVAEFRAAWLPHVTDSGLARVTELLEKVPMGCLASHIAWNHPQTCRFQFEAGIMWLARVAKLNPATSEVILAWDRYGTGDYELRAGLLEACREEVARREAEAPRPVNRVRDLLTA
jgi:hypothetical protein